MSWFSKVFSSPRNLFDLFSPGVPTYSLIGGHQHYYIDLPNRDPRPPEFYQGRTPKQQPAWRRNPVTDTFTFDEQQANLHKVQIRYLAKLQDRLRQGKITQKYYDDSLWLAYQELDSPDSAYWGEFLKEVAKNATTNLDGTLKTAAGYVTDAAAGVADYAGTAAGKVVGAAGRGIFSNLGFGGFGLVLVVGGVIYWLIKNGGLKKVL